MGIKPLCLAVPAPRLLIHRDWLRLQMYLLEELEGVSLASLASSAALMADPEACSAASSGLTESILLTSSSSSNHCPTYDELVELMTCAMARLSLDRTSPRQEVTLDEGFLLDHKHPAPVSLSFLLKLHTEVSGLWRNLYSSHIVLSNSSYVNVEGLCEQGYGKMFPVKDNLARYLSLGSSSSLKAPFLPSKQCQTT